MSAGANVIPHPTFGRRVAPPPAKKKRPRHPKAPAVERLPADRVRLALEAGWELGSIATALLSGCGVSDEIDRDMLCRALHQRIAALASVVMSVCGDDTGCETADMHEVVHGVRPSSEAV